MSSEQLNFILAFTSILTTLILIATLFIVKQQTSQLAEQTKQLGKQTKLNASTNNQLYVHGINQLFLEDESLTRLIGESKESILAFIILNLFHYWFRFHEPDFMDETYWEERQFTIKKIMSQDAMLRLWESVKPEYDLEFREFIDSFCKN